VIDVRPVRDRRALRQFIDLPYRAYRGHPHWVPPLRLVEWARLDARKNPFHDHAVVQPFLACRGDAVVGRIAAVDDQLHNDVHGDDLAAFGWFEADGAASARALLSAVEEWARARGRSRVRGPLSPSMHDLCGLLVDGFDRAPCVMMPYNPPEYGAFVEQAGYAPARDLYAWSVERDTPAAQKLQPRAARFATRHRLRVRSLDRRRLAEAIAGFRTVYNRAWERNWGFVAPTEREFRHQAHDLNQIADPQFVLGVEADGVTVGFAVALPDINQALAGTDGRLLPLGLYRFLTRRRRIDQLRLTLLGVVPEARALGIYVVLLAELFARAQGSPYRRFEASWVLDGNDDVNRTLAALGGVRTKTYRLYEAPLPLA
jgi:GNAT superfamily N-acetyltransferase